jgi:hypothetical protein
VFDAFPNPDDGVDTLAIFEHTEDIGAKVGPYERKVDVTGAGHDVIVDPPTVVQMQS